jgi:hypothetical protein
VMGPCHSERSAREAHAEARNRDHLGRGNCHSERRRGAPEARNRDHPDRGIGPSAGTIAIPRLRAFGAPLGMTEGTV